MVLQARMRGRTDRQRAKTKVPPREWVFERSYERTFDTNAKNHEVFYIERNEKIEIVTVGGNGRLLLSATDKTGQTVVEGGVVYDSSAHAFLVSTTAKKGLQPALWSAPGEYEYKFELQPLPGSESALMHCHFRKEITWGERDLVSEPTPKRSTEYLSLKRDAAKTKQMGAPMVVDHFPPPPGSGGPGTLADATLQRADEVERQQAQAEAEHEQAVLAQVDGRPSAPSSRPSGQMSASPLMTRPPLPGAAPVTDGAQPGSPRMAMSPSPVGQQQQPWGGYAGYGNSCYGGYPMQQPYMDPSSMYAAQYMGAYPSMCGAQQPMQQPMGGGQPGPAVPKPQRRAAPRGRK